MPSTEVSAGTIHYEEVGEGPPLVMVGGLAMDGASGRGSRPSSAPTHRCLMPTLPFGSHPEPMRADADLSLRGMGRIVAEFIESLGLDGVTLCFNDWSGAQVMVADGLLDRVVGPRPRLLRDRGQLPARPRRPGRGRLGEIARRPLGDAADAADPVAAAAPVRLRADVASAVFPTT